MNASNGKMSTAEMYAAGPFISLIADYEEQFDTTVDDFTELFGEGEMSTDEEGNPVFLPKKGSGHSASTEDIPFGEMWNNSVGFGPFLREMYDQFPIINWATGQQNWMTFANGKKMARSPAKLTGTQKKTFFPNEDQIGWWD